MAARWARLGGIGRCASCLLALTALSGLSLLAACADQTPSQGQAGFMGQTYTAQEYLINGEQQPLEPGTTLSLTFTGEGVSASAGCNTMSAAGGIQDGVLHLAAPMASTTMACDPAIMEQEHWWSQFMQSQPQVQVTQDGLVLRSGGTEVTMTAQRIQSDLPLIGTAWQLQTILSGSTASSVPSGTTSTLTVSSTAATVATSGCPTITSPAMVADGTITVSPEAFAGISCTPDGAPVAQAVAGVFAPGTASYDIVGDSLTLRSSGGGIVYRGG